MASSIPLCTCSSLFLCPVGKWGEEGNRPVGRVLLRHHALFAPRFYGTSLKLEGVNIHVGLQQMSPSFNDVQVQFIELIRLPPFQLCILIVNNCEAGAASVCVDD